MVLVVQAGCKVLRIACVGANAGVSWLLLPVWRIKTRKYPRFWLALRTHEETPVIGRVARNTAVMLSVGAGEGACAAARIPRLC